MNYYEIKFSSEKGDIKDILDMILERADDAVRLKVRKCESGFLTIKEEALKKPEHIMPIMSDDIKAIIREGD